MRRILTLSGCDSQVWYDTTLTKDDKPSVCTAFMAALAPTDGPNVHRKSGSKTIILPTTVNPTKTVKDGCKVHLPVMCM